MSELINIWQTEYYISITALYQRVVLSYPHISLRKCVIHHITRSNNVIFDT